MIEESWPFDLCPFFVLYGRRQAKWNKRRDNNEIQLFTHKKKHDDKLFSSFHYPSLPLLYSSAHMAEVREGGWKKARVEWKWKLNSYLKWWIRWLLCIFWREIVIWRGRRPFGETWWVARWLGRLFDALLCQLTPVVSLFGEPHRSTHFDLCVGNFSRFTFLVFFFFSLLNLLRKFFTTFLSATRSYLKKLHSLSL